MAALYHGGAIPRGGPHGRGAASVYNQGDAGERSDRVIKTILRVVLALAMIVVGVAHFAVPEPFLAIMPSALPYHLALVYISGVFEVLGGAGLLIPRTRKAAGWGLIALYIAVFPANVNQLVNRIPLGDEPPPEWALWVRLPLQLVLIAWAYWMTRDDAPKDTPSESTTPP